MARVPSLVHICAKGARGLDWVGRGGGATRLAHAGGGIYNAPTPPWPLMPDRRDEEGEKECRY
eukprot:211975-Pyramimonas_sp.AAC.1